MNKQKLKALLADARAGRILKQDCKNPETPIYQVYYQHKEEFDIELKKNTNNQLFKTLSTS